MSPELTLCAANAPALHSSSCSCSSQNILFALMQAPSCRCFVFACHLSLKLREEILFLHVPSISTCDDSCCSSAILIEFFFHRPLSHVHFRVVSFRSVSQSVSHRITHAAGVLVYLECLYHLSWVFKMLSFKRLAVSLRTLQKLAEAHRWHHTSLTSTCIFYVKSFT